MLLLLPFVAQLLIDSGITVASGGGTTNVFDFTGLPRAMCILTASNNTTTLIGVFAYIVWTGSTLILANIVSTSALAAFSATPILQLKNTSIVGLSDVYWTLQFMRVQ